MAVLVSSPRAVRDATAQPKTGPVAAQEGASGPTIWALFVGALMFLVGIAAASALNTQHIYRGDVQFAPSDGVSAFALFFLAAIVVERTIEPFSASMVRASPKNSAADGPGSLDKVVGKTKAAASNARVTALAAAAGGGEKESENTTKAADEGATADQATANGTFIIWGVATFLSVFLCYFLALSLPKALGVTGLDPTVDLVVTAIAVGAGSKPMHDFISLIQDSKKDATTESAK